MSGGSLNYAYRHVETAAEAILRTSKSPLHGAFGEHLLKVAKALHELEWFWSGDSLEAPATQAIHAVLERDAELKYLIAKAEATLETLTAVLVAAKASVT